ncbi:MAG: hypothetical protein C5B60_08490 [Chloroflexi bacterium]|nr:MAG: hypothetical protein C5B60_08490 [Chloroflexota bacterium]
MILQRSPHSRKKWSPTSIDTHAYIVPDGNKNSHRVHFVFNDFGNKYNSERSSNFAAGVEFDDIVAALTMLAKHGDERAQRLNEFLAPRQSLEEIRAELGLTI